MGFLRKKANGFSLVENLVALVILLTVFTISVKIFLNIFTAQNLKYKTLATIKAEAELNKKLMINEDFDLTSDSEVLVTDVEISLSSQYSGTLLNNITSSKDGKILCSINELTLAN